MTEYEYIINSTSLKERYDRICAIIRALEDQQIAVISNSDVESYTLDDGQTRINTTYRSALDIAKAIDSYERVKNRIQGELLGTRIVALRDAKTVQSNERFN